MLVAAVAPAVRRLGDEQTMRLIARRFGVGSAVALATAVATGVALASHFSLWDSEILQAKLMVLVLVGVLAALHMVSPRSRCALPTALSPRRCSCSGSASAPPTAERAAPPS